MTEQEDRVVEAAVAALRALQGRGEPYMQLVRIKVAGVDYQCFGSIMDDSDAEVPEVQAIEFGDIVPMSMVIGWMIAAQEAHRMDKKGQMQ